MPLHLPLQAMEVVEGVARLRISYRRHAHQCCAADGHDFHLWILMSLGLCDLGGDEVVRRVSSQGELDGLSRVLRKG